MNFWQRFRFFLVGFVPGCIILMLIVNKKGCSSPNELKMLELSHQHLEVGPKVKCKLKCLVMVEAGFKIAMRDYKVDYDLSDVHKKPYGLYYLKPLNAATARYEMMVEDKDTVTYVDDIKLLKAIPGCNCDTIQ